MKAERIGRVMGIGLRVAGRIVGAHLAGNPRPGQPRPAGSATISAPAAQQAGRAAARGVGGFLKPFRRVGGILWLEVTGTFFLLFALVFAGYAWQSWKANTIKSVELSIAVGALFLYLGLSSFWRARRK